MKNKYVLIILASTILGILIGNMIRDYNRRDSIFTDKGNLAKKEVKLITKNIKELRKEGEVLEEELSELKDKYEDVEKIKEVNTLKRDLSYTDVEGSGIALSIDAQNEEIGNIANFVDYNKILVNIVNELKLNGAEFISINGQRINQYSPIVLAGSHINVNLVPIAPQYEIKCVGDKEKLSKYIKKGSVYLKSIQDNYPIKVGSKVLDTIVINKMNVPNKLKYIEGE